jgi:hypothetical protein
MIDNAFKVVGLNCEKPNKNNRIYPREVLERIAADINAKLIPLTIGNGECSNIDIKIEDMVGIAKEAFVKNNELYITFEKLKTPKAKILENLGGRYDIYPAGIGSTEDFSDKPSVVNVDYHIHSFSIVPLSDSKKD